jgi:tetratricopeptide (TPR) repeat protein
MHVGAPSFNVRFNRIWSALALLFFLVRVEPALWAQDGEWDKHMKAGGKASASFKYAKAEQEFQAALAQTQAFPPNDFRTAETLSKLAALYVKEAKLTEAENRQKQAVAIFEASAGPEDPRLAYAQIGLAVIYDFERKGEEFESRRDEAAPIWNRFFPIVKKAAKPSDPEVLSTMIDLRNALRDLARMYEGQKQDSDAETAETRILAIDATAFGPDSPETGSDAETLGRLYEREGRYGAAFPLLLLKLEISRKIYRKDSSVSGVHKGAATAWDAMVAMLEVPFFHENVPGPFLDAHWARSYELLRECRELAKVGAESGKYPEAAELYKQIIPLDEKEAGSNQEFKIRELAEDLMDLSRVYRHEKRYDDAVDTIKQSEMVDERAAKAKFAKPEQVALLHWYSQNEMAEIYREKGDIAAAIPLFERSLETSDKMPVGAGHARIAELLSDYANLLGDQGNFDAAESFYKRALDTWAKSWYPQQLEEAETLTNYAALLRKLDRPVEAEPLEARAAAIQAKVSASTPAN